MTKTFRLTTVNDAIDIATRLTRSWFRGHPCRDKCLLPRIFRPWYRPTDPWGKVFAAMAPEPEMRTIEAFKRHAPALADWPLLADDDRLGWLCVMQHYGAPTRLLDWTENALVGLYFAVSSHPSDDGELWAMLPWALNEAAGAGWGIPIPSQSQLVKYLLEQAYWNGTEEALAKSIALAHLTAPDHRHRRASVAIPADRSRRFAICRSSARKLDRPPTGAASGPDRHRRHDLRCRYGRSEIRRQRWSCVRVAPRRSEQAHGPESHADLAAQAAATRDAQGRLRGLPASLPTCANVTHHQYLRIYAAGVTQHSPLKQLELTLGAATPQRAHLGALLAAEPGRAQ
jgi:hypothetical protein